MKNSSSREFECERKTLSRSRNHHVPTRLSERGETRHAHYRHAIYRESRCGNIAMRRRGLGDPRHEWKRGRGRVWLSITWCIARRVYETQARARKISVVFELLIASSDKRVAIETYYFSLLLPPLSSFSRTAKAFLLENINISRSCWRLIAVNDRVINCTECRFFFCSRRLFARPNLLRPLGQQNGRSVFYFRLGA